MNANLETDSEFLIIRNARYAELWALALEL